MTPTVLVSSKEVQEVIAEAWGITGWGDVVAKLIIKLGIQLLFGVHQ